MEAACDARGDLPVDPLDGISSLLDKSLLRQEEGPEDEPRFSMLETIHEYARERLEESGEAEEIRRLHAEYFLSLAEEAEPELKGSNQPGWLDRLEAEHDNMRAALSWSLEAGEAELGLRIAGSLWWFWNVRGHQREGVRWYEEGLHRGDVVPRPVRAKALLGAGALLYGLSDLDSAADRLESGLALYGQLGDKRGAAACLLYLGMSATDEGDWGRAEALLEEGLALARGSGGGWVVRPTLGMLAKVTSWRGDPERAKALEEEALALAREAGDARDTAAITVGVAWTAMTEGDHGRAQALLEEGLDAARVVRDRFVEGYALHNLGILALLRGDPARAAKLSSESLRISEDLLDPLGVTFSLDALAAACGERGDLRRAARLWGAAEAVREARGFSRPPDDWEVLGPFLEAARSRLGGAAFRAAWAEGRATTEGEAVALALDGEGGGSPARAEPA